jgi:NADH-quinone oxidoreductase subunit N
MNCKLEFGMFLEPNILDTIQGDLNRDLRGFVPELVLCAGIVILLLLRLLPTFDRVHMGWVSLALSLAALAVAVLDFIYPSTSSVDLFTGLLRLDNFTLFLRLFLLAFTTLVIWLTLLTRIPDREDSADFHVLLLGATLGMMIMSEANHLLMMYIGVEMASLPSYGLAGFLKGKRQSSEAALKYVVYGGGASGIMVYGISLLAGKFGTAYLPQLAQGYLSVLHGATEIDAVLVLGTLLFLIGVAFKLAAVPFQFWCPDVFEGASAEVAGFLSVASKGAALALLGRFVMVLIAGGAGFQGTGSLAVHPDNTNLLRYLAPALAGMAALTATFGNLAAYVQTNLKRLLAYSTIAHAGYMLMGLATLTAEGAGAVLFYLIAYLLMNLGAFAIVAFLRNQTGSEDLADFRGLVRRSPIMVVTLSIFLLSLLGIPPLVGFAGKFQIFSALYHAGEHYGSGANPDTMLSNTMIALLVIGGINTVISAVYYVKVMKVMILDSTLEDIEEREPRSLVEPPGAVVYATFLAVLIFGAFLLWNPLDTASRRGVQQFREVQTPPVPLAEMKGQ